ncbi:hypothetical protein BDZ85DRAFT_62947 [Elsinoe ampelina]|uniref:Uncharacterized protein n=1 Tax=Elsinoe ampelina TaxID=302913 RepID=A0A6A6FZS8_9PEZI|nr:hypothetical protein BDZ85DRAFT_62947 [Elsinoe ampelina]
MARVKYTEPRKRRSGVFGSGSKSATQLPTPSSPNPGHTAMNILPPTPLRHDAVNLFAPMSIPAKDVVAEADHLRTTSRDSSPEQPLCQRHKRQRSASSALSTFSASRNRLRRNRQLSDSIYAPSTNHDSDDDGTVDNEVAGPPTLSKILRLSYRPQALRSDSGYGSPSHPEQRRLRLDTTIASHRSRTSSLNNESHARHPDDPVTPEMLPNVAITLAPGTDGEDGRLQNLERDVQAVKTTVSKIEQSLGSYITQLQELGQKMLQSIEDRAGKTNDILHVGVSTTTGNEGMHPPSHRSCPEPADITSSFPRFRSLQGARIGPIAGTDPTRMLPPISTLYTEATSSPQSLATVTSMLQDLTHRFEGLEAACRREHDLQERLRSAPHARVPLSVEQADMLFERYVNPLNAKWDRMSSQLKEAFSSKSVRSRPSENSARGQPEQHAQLLSQLADMNSVHLLLDGRLNGIAASLANLEASQIRSEASRDSERQHVQQTLNGLQQQTKLAAAIPSAIDSIRKQQEKTILENTQCHLSMTSLLKKQDDLEVSIKGLRVQSANYHAQRSHREAQIMDLLRLDSSDSKARQEQLESYLREWHSDSSKERAESAQQASQQSIILDNVQRLLQDQNQQMTESKQIPLIPWETHEAAFEKIGTDLRELRSVQVGSMRCHKESVEHLLQQQEQQIRLIMTALHASDERAMKSFDDTRTSFNNTASQLSALSRCSEEARTTTYRVLNGNNGHNVAVLEKLASIEATETDLRNLMTDVAVNVSYLQTDSNANHGLLQDAVVKIEGSRDEQRDRFDDVSRHLVKIEESQIKVEDIDDRLACVPQLDDSLQTMAGNLDSLSKRMVSSEQSMADQAASISAVSEQVAHIQASHDQQQYALDAINDRLSILEPVALAEDKILIKLEDVTAQIAKDNKLDSEKLADKVLASLSNVSTKLEGICQPSDAMDRATTTLKDDFGIKTSKILSSLQDVSKQCKSIEESQAPSELAVLKLDKLSKQIADALRGQVSSAELLKRFDAVVEGIEEEHGTSAKVLQALCQLLSLSKQSATYPTLNEIRKELDERVCKHKTVMEDPHTVNRLSAVSKIFDEMPRCLPNEHETFDRNLQTERVVSVVRKSFDETPTSVAGELPSHEVVMEELQEDRKLTALTTTSEKVAEGSPSLPPADTSTQIYTADGLLDLQVDSTIEEPVTESTGSLACKDNQRAEKRHRIRKRHLKRQRKMKRLEELEKQDMHMTAGEVTEVPHSAHFKADELSASRKRKCAEEADEAPIDPRFLFASNVQNHDANKHKKRQKGRSRRDGVKDVEVEEIGSGLKKKSKAKEEHPSFGWDCAVSVVASGNWDDCLEQHTNHKKRSKSNKHSSRGGKYGIEQI